MRFSKLITAGILALTFAYVNSIQNKFMTKFGEIPANEQTTPVPPSEITISGTTCCVEVPVPPHPESAKKIDIKELPLFIFHKMGFSPVLRSLFYPFTKILTLSSPELPDSGSNAKTSIS